MKLSTTITGIKLLVRDCGFRFCKGSRNSLLEAGIYNLFQFRSDIPLVILSNCRKPRQGCAYPPGNLYLDNRLAMLCTLFLHSPVLAFPTEFPTQWEFVNRGHRADPAQILLERSMRSKKREKKTIFNGPDEGNSATYVNLLIFKRRHLFRSLCLDGGD
jgi:hypothetical protein